MPIKILQAKDPNAYLTFWGLHTHPGNRRRGQKDRLYSIKISAVTAFSLFDSNERWYLGVTVGDDYRTTIITRDLMADIERLGVFDWEMTERARKWLGEQKAAKTAEEE